MMGIMGVSCGGMGVWKRMVPESEGVEGSVGGGERMAL